MKNGVAYISLERVRKYTISLFEEELREDFASRKHVFSDERYEESLKALTNIVIPGLSVHP